MNVKSLLIICLSSFYISIIGQKTPADFVNTFIGTGGHGHTYPGATVPFGMVQLSPDTRLEGWDGCGGYHYTDNYIYGFSHTHLNGTGIPDLCDILFMPFAGKVEWMGGTIDNPGYGSAFDHKDEKASPGYYQVLLKKNNIRAELTASQRCGMHQYTFPKDVNPNILIDLVHRDEVLESSIRIVGNNRIEGMRRSRSWANNQYVFFVAEFSKPFKGHQLASNGKINNETTSENGTNIKAVLQFDSDSDIPLLVKVGISSVSIDGAALNLKTEMPDWDFEKIKTTARNAWNKELSKIMVEDDDVEKKTIFYSALYHTMVDPNIFMDVDGKFRGRDLKIHTAEGFTNYTVFSLWDVYRAWFPLMSIIDQKRYLDYIKTFLHQYDHDGYLPVWELYGNETNCMIGYHSIPPITDAYIKGIRKFDATKALVAMKKSAFKINNPGLTKLHEKGFISLEDEVESAAKTLEYAYDDWCIAQFAKAIGNSKEYQYFIRRGQNYKNMFDKSTGFMRARSNGGWFNPFDPFEVNFNYTEANSWQYSFTAVQDISGFIGLHGGKANVAKKLDDLFTVSSQTKGREQSDITGLIGQYAHGNEPSHHMAFLYSFVGQPWKTQEKVHKIRKELYANQPDGLSGNEDCGQMSAWLVMNALGFYQVTPGTDYYVFGTPWFKKVTIQLENGKQFVIRANGVSDDQFYIQSASLNGKAHHHSFIRHNEIMNGGHLDFELSEKSGSSWGTGQGNEPTTAITDNLIVPSPAIMDATKSFKNNKLIEISGPNNTKLYYQINKMGKIGPKILYRSPFTIDQSCSISFWAEDGKSKSKIVSSEFVKMPDDRDITLAYMPENQYSSGGGNNLIDGIRCAPDFRINGWLGFEKKNLEAIIDLRTQRNLSKFAASFIQDINAWVFFPTKIEFLISDDGINYAPIGTILNDIDPAKDGAMLKLFELPQKNVKGRFVKVIAHNIGLCPPGHKGQGFSAWLFADEILVN
jgi:predicted alpha-1,2-mannosidase